MNKTFLYYNEVSHTVEKTVMVKMTTLTYSFNDCFRQPIIPLIQSRGKFKSKRPMT